MLCNRVLNEPKITDYQLDITLYITDACTLCDEAIDMILDADALKGHALQTVDVIVDQELMDRFGEILPVVQVGHRNKAWPFDIEDVVALLETKESS